MKRRSLSSPWLVGIGQRLAGSVLLAALVATTPACDPASAGHNHNHHHGTYFHNQKYHHGTYNFYHYRRTEYHVYTNKNQYYYYYYFNKFKFNFEFNKNIDQNYYFNYN